MTCVWQGLIKALDLKTKPDAFVKYCKSHNTPVRNIQVNGQVLTESQIRENQQHIENINNIENGYLCSACDPILILVAHLFNTIIIHQFNGTIIQYEPESNDDIVNQDFKDKKKKKKKKHCFKKHNVSKTIRVYSNSHHFWT